MKYISRIILIFVTLFSFFGNVWAADKDIVVLSFNHGDSVSLRWAPGSEELFRRSVKSGYLVQRRAVGEKNWKNISSVLKPVSNERLAIMEALDPDASTIKEVLYPSADRK
ncbi:MAG: fibronectin type III domain-containing protein, partial [Paludibacteraceae bacterium]|nr:fibronectin type III domain-containing protein [Paludibacteraceae bacterium]